AESSHFRTHATGRGLHHVPPHVHRRQRGDYGGRRLGHRLPGVQSDDGASGAGEEDVDLAGALPGNPAHYDPDLQVALNPRSPDNMDPHSMVHTANQIALNFALIRMKKPSPTSPLI